MRSRIASLALVTVLVAPLQGAFAAEFGTSSSAQLTPFGGDPAGAHASQTLVDVLPADTAASLVDGVDSAQATTLLGVNQAAVTADSGAIARASSLWSDTFTITSLLGASGSAPIAYHLRVDGSLDAGQAIGGHAQILLHAFTGIDANAQNELLPNVILDAAELVLDEACGFDWTEGPAPLCEPPAPIHGVLDFTTSFTYGAPFRFDALLELLAEDGGHAEFGSEFDRIELPAGAVLTAASGRDYSDACVTPEPGTLALVALGLAALRIRRTSRA